MTSSDKSVVMQLLKNTPEFKADEMPVAEEVIDSYLNNPRDSGYHALVALIDSQIIGYTCYGPAPLTSGTWDIYWTAVSHSIQRLGIGKALLSYVEKQIKKAGGRMVFIETSSTINYEKSRRFHISQGYELISQIEDFYAIGDHKLIFRKIITNAEEF
jgi:ribosomal protein S18 acetylase RimI-like enzyme